MLAEFLTAIPVSGTVRERHFSTSAGRNAWVRFDSGEGGEWVGVFGAGGLSPFTAAVPFGDDAGRTVLVVAGGQGYIVDAATGTLLLRTPWDYAYALAAPPARDFVLVADTTRIWAAGRGGDVDATAAVRHAYEWAWPDLGGGRRPPTRVALDGIVFDPPGPGAVTGKAWQPDGWYAFRLAYDTMAVEPGPLVSAEWAGVPPHPSRGAFGAGPDVAGAGHLL